MKLKETSVNCERKVILAEFVSCDSESDIDRSAVKVKVILAGFFDVAFSPPSTLLSAQLFGCNSSTSGAPSYFLNIRLDITITWPIFKQDWHNHADCYPCRRPGVGRCVLAQSHHAHASSGKVIVVTNLSNLTNWPILRTNYLAHASYVFEGLKFFEELITFVMIVNNKNKKYLWKLA